MIEGAPFWARITLIHKRSVMVSVTAWLWGRVFSCCLVGWELERQVGFRPRGLSRSDQAAKVIYLI